MSTLYAELKNTLYGKLKVALLFWRKLTKVIKPWGFKINPYEWCVANANIKGKQCTIFWNVDDLKISQMDTEIVTPISKKLESVFVKDSPLTIQRIKNLDYLGMDFYFRKKGRMGMGMVKIIQAMLKDIP